MIGVLDRGVCLIFIPLLTLSADVMAKFQSACQHYGSNRAYHLDELYDANTELYADVIDACIDIESHPSSTTQHLWHSTRARNTFISCAAKGFLRTIVLDEVHLHVAHGLCLSFREECHNYEKSSSNQFSILKAMTFPHHDCFVWLLLSQLTTSTAWNTSLHDHSPVTLNRCNEDLPRISRGFPTTQHTHVAACCTGRRFDQDGLGPSGATSQ